MLFHQWPLCFKLDIILPISWQDHIISQCSDKTLMGFELSCWSSSRLCVVFVGAHEQNKVLTENGNLMKALWRQPVVSVAVVTPVRTAKRQSDRVSVVTADFCYFCLLSSYRDWKLSELNRRLILDKGSSVRTLSRIPWKRRWCILMGHDLWP